MDSYWLNLASAAIGVLVSPLAIMASIVVLLSRRPGANSLAFLVGWVTGIVAALAILLAISNAAADDAPSGTPTWVAWVRIVVGTVLLIGAVYSFVRGRHRVRRMAAAVSAGDIVAAAPQLPGWLSSIEHFTPARSLVLGVGLCILNPVDLSFIALAAITLSNATPTSGSWIVGALLFVIISASSVAAPVIYYAIKKSQPTNRCSDSEHGLRHAQPAQHRSPRRLRPGATDQRSASALAERDITARQRDPTRKAPRLLPHVNWDGITPWALDDVGGAGVDMTNVFGMP